MQLAPRLFAICVLAFMLVQCVFALSARHPSWEEWKQQHKRAFTPDEDVRRKAIYEANMDVADGHITRNPLAQFGANDFSDMTSAEFKVYHNADAYFKKVGELRRSGRASGAVRAVVSKEALESVAATGAASSVDWRAKGAVTYVKNQGQCGSCWSFSTTGNIEGQWFLAGNTLVAVSEQELVSCDTTNSACNGGLMDNAFEWLVSARGGWITGENFYPYVSGAGQVPQCSMAGKPKIAQVTGHTDLPHDEKQMAAWISTGGPVSIGVDATSWQSYQGGVMTNCISKAVDHGVLIVGFNTAHSPPYWIIKNSWAASWGENGYIRIGFGTNQCLITTAPSSSIAGTSPAPPAPPAPAPPAPPAPATGTFTQYQCTDSLCESGCKANSFPTGSCLPLSGGGSAIATCGQSNLHLQQFSTSDCTGGAQEQDQPLNQCVQEQSGGYFETKCAGSSSSSGSGSSSSSIKVANLMVAKRA